MNLPGFSLRRPAVVWALVAILGFAGAWNFGTMARREDPAIRIRTALVLTAWPGAPTRKVEELVTDPLEKRIAEIAEVDTITSESRAGFSKITVELEETTEDVEQAWDELRAKVGEVVLPEGCRPPRVNSDFGQVYEVCLALFQTPPEGGWTEETERFRYGPRDLEVYAELVEDELMLVPEVARVDFWGVAEERLWVEADTGDWARLELTADRLADLMEARNIVAPGGEVTTGSERFSVRPTGEFRTEGEVADVVCGLVDGRVPARLRDLPLRVRRGTEEPLRTKVRYAAPGTAPTRALIVAASMRDGRNLVDMGEGIAARVRRLRAEVLPPDLALVRVNDLPRQVDTKVRDFAVNLAESIAIVLGMAFLLIGARPGLVMAAAVPLSMLAAIAVMPLFGVELEQFSIASLIISMGLVVDNATVVTENAMRLMGEGASRREAVLQGAKGVAVPVLAGTLTTVAAFLPMLTITGNMGEYIRSLPIVVAATLTASYLVALCVAPILCERMLDPEALRRKAGKEGGGGAGARVERAVAWCTAHKGLVLGGAGAAFVASLLLLRAVGSQFFPEGDRDQFFLQTWLPEGASLEATEHVVEQVEQAVLRASPDPEGGGERLAHLVTFVGSGGPRLMLTQSLEQDAPYYAHTVVTTRDAAATKWMVEAVREAVRAIPGARVEVIPFAFGPPIPQPVAFRLSGEDDGVLRTTAERMLEVLRTTPGAEAPSSDWGGSSYEVEVRIDSDAANLAGVTNADVALTMNALLSGARLTTYREGDHLVPVMLKTSRGAREPLTDLSGIFVSGRRGKVPLESFAEVAPAWQPAVIARRNNVRTVTVGCRVAEGMLANAVSAAAAPRLARLLDDLPPGTRLEAAGEKEETAESQAKIGMASVVALFLIVLVLVFQYNSFLKPLVILITLPLAMIGVILGLYVTGWALGFMAMLGVLALFGIVINNAILLIEFLEEKVRDGTPLREAAAIASRVRLKPILLTSLTTVGGLLPLSLFGGALWAPLSNGMIFGLAFSTVLTVVVVPTLYVLFAEKLGMRVLPDAP